MTPEHSPDDEEQYDWKDDIASELTEGVDISGYAHDYTTIIALLSKAELTTDATVTRTGVDEYYVNLKDTTPGHSDLLEEIESHPFHHKTEHPSGEYVKQSVYITFITPVR